MTGDRIFHAAQIRPGDRVLITCADNQWSHAQREEITAGLQQRFPGVVFTLVSGVSGVAVLPGDQPVDPAWGRLDGRG